MAATKGSIAAAACGSEVLFFFDPLGKMALASAAADKG
jgi:hypothetical protein